MQFLVALSLFACAANAATVYQPWQVPQQAVFQAVASASVGPQATRSFVAQPVAQPVAKAFSAVSRPAVQTFEPVQPVAITVKNVGNVKDVEAGILRSDSNVAADGFNFVYETANGIAAQAQGTLKKVNDVNTIAVEGSYQYLNAEGVPVVVRYIADENGYQPQSDLIPTAPPVPAAILRSLEYIASQPKYVEPSKRLV